jgi:1-acyl-sn-glycerol-3-phosphate acyltransferase
MTRYRSFLASQSLLSRAFYFVARSLVFGFCRAWTRFTLEGRELVPAQGPCILAPVHRSNMDTPFTAMVTRRRVRFMGKDSLWRKPFWAWFLSALGGFPVSRGTVDLEAMKRCLEVLEAGEPLVLFPEGERKAGSTVQPLFEGAAYLALKAGVPIVPIGIGGSERVMPKGSKLIHPHKVHVIVGAPIVPGPPGPGRVPRERVHELTNELHTRLQKLFDEAEGLLQA